MVLSSVCVYCGSSSLVAPKFKEAAQTLGAAVARRGWTLVYGGGHVGLMGLIADAALAQGGPVVGIIPEHIRAQEVQHDNLTELHVVPDMHTRKRMMAERADAFVILPGGLGTLDEAFEILTWKKLNLHSKPIVLLNQDGYWDSMVALVEKTIMEGFSQTPDRSLMQVVDSVEEVLAALDEPKAPKVSSYYEKA